MSDHSPRTSVTVRIGEAELRRLRSGDRVIRARIWEALDAALRGKVLSAGGERVAPRFRSILRDVPTAEDFIAERSMRLIEGLEAERIGLRFDERNGDLVDYLTQAGLLLRKAIQWRADRLIDEQALAGDAEEDWNDPMGTIAVAGSARRTPDAGRRIDRLLRMPLVPDFTAAGGPTQRRFVCMQFWPRLEPPTRDAWKAELERTLAQSGSSLDELVREHESARIRIGRELEGLSAGRPEGRPRTPRAEAEFDRQVRSLRVELLIHPLDAAAVRRLLGVSDANAFQLKRRLVASLEAILPDLASLLGPAADPEDPT